MKLSVILKSGINSNGFRTVVMDDAEALCRYFRPHLAPSCQSFCAVGRSNCYRHGQRQSL